MIEREDKKKYKAGLHKEISSIFDGVPIPGGNNAQQPSKAPAPQGTGPVPPKPSREPEPKRPVDKVQEMPVQPAPKAAPVKEPKAAARKTHRISPWLQQWRKIKDKLFARKEGVSSSRQKIVLILIPVLFIVLIFVLYPILKGSSQRRLEPGGVKPKGIVAGFNGEINWRVPEPYPSSLRDPMQAGMARSIAFGPSGAESSELEIRKAASMVVRGIVHSEDYPAAVIGTQIVHEGDILSGVRIVKINQDSVVFEMADKSWIQKVQR